MTPAVALQLGRVSNLPTVLTNVLAGIILAGATPLDLRTLPVLLAMSAFYVGGMFLNDAFDAEIDARERPERPIPSGQVSRRSVFASGFGLLLFAVLLIIWVGTGFAAGTGWWPVVSATCLAAAIVFYDWFHKANPLSPLVMGICRVLVYVTAGVCFNLPVNATLLTGAGLLLCYLIGLTYIAKQENLGRVENLWPLIFLAAPVAYGLLLAAEQPLVGVFWIAFTAWMLFALWLVKRRGAGDVPRAVVSLIAGISLLDAMLIGGAGMYGFAALAALGFFLTLALQRFVSGT
ncbi:MAG: UbiA family prenyltransferase [Gammaproteobacteria bacterium]|nr:UbiA family prenyltransferase [Gammaproteobacteria bacterium]